MEKYRLIYWKDDIDINGQYQSYWVQSVEDYSLNDVLARLFQKWYDGSPFSRYYDSDWGPWGLTDWMDILIVRSDVPDQPIFWVSEQVRDRYFPAVRMNMKEFLELRQDIDPELKANLLRMWKVFEKDT